MIYVCTYIRYYGWFIDVFLLPKNCWIKAIITIKIEPKSSFFCIFVCSECSDFLWCGFSFFFLYFRLFLVYYFEKEHSECADFRGFCKMVGTRLLENVDFCFENHCICLRGSTFLFLLRILGNFDWFNQWLIKSTITNFLNMVHISVTVAVVAPAQQTIKSWWIFWIIPNLIRKFYITYHQNNWIRLFFGQILKIWF